MSGSGFPQRKSQGAGGMTSPGAGQEVLDGPPPSPVMANTSGTLPTGMTGPQPMPDLARMAGPMTAGTPGRAVSPEIVTGMMQTAQTVYSIFDSFASIAPDLANDMALLKSNLDQALAKLFVNNGQTGNPASTGVNFPGGGFASGAQ